jgi:hypothetical protein
MPHETSFPRVRFSLQCANPKGVTKPRWTRAFFLIEGYIDEPTDRVEDLRKTSAAMPTHRMCGELSFQSYSDYEIKGFNCWQLTGRACGRTIAN